MRVELYLDALSSWCLMAAPAWGRLRAAYEGRVRFSWSIALIDRADGLGYTPEIMDWYYRRTARITGERLNPNWIEGPHTGSLNANLVVAAARTMGVDDDRAWLAIANAGMREGRHVGRLEVAAEVAGSAAGLDPRALAARAQDEDVLAYVRDSTDRFRDLGLPQRPAFVISDDIGDEARISGLWVAEPIASTLDAMMGDVDGYRNFMLDAPPEPERLP